MAEHKSMMGNTRQKQKKKIGRKSETERIRVVEDRDEKTIKKTKEKQKMLKEKNTQNAMIETDRKI